MPDTKITALTALTAADPANDVLPIVDVSDTTMAASGTTKKISINNVLGASGTATLASATITGNLTVDTNTFFVDAANNRVGIGTATPAYPLDVVGVINTNSEIYATGGRLALYRTAGASYLDHASGQDLIFRTVTSAGGAGPSELMRLNSSGNVGIGVTPSAWNSNYNALDIGQNGTISGRVGTSNTVDIVSNGYRNSAGNWVYKLATSNTACRYQLDGSTGGHIWYSGAAGTAGNTIAGFSTATMTLDASGNLILLSSNTPATLTTNGQLTVNATSNTNLRFSYRGSDGVTRTADLTLA